MMDVVRNKRSFFEFVHFLAPPNGTTLENATIDVANKGCFATFDTVACIRNWILSVFISVTFLLCIGRIVRLHLVKHPQAHHYFIFYFASVECLICGFNWMIGNHLPQLDFAASYLKLLQFIVVCHLHWTLATRILHKEKLVKRVIVPILASYFAYFTTITILGVISVKSSWIECLEPDWILLSFVEFIVVQLFMIAGIYITKKINAVSTVESLKRAQKRDLWSVIAAYEVSALVSVVYDLTMLMLGNEAQSCSAIFGHEQFIYSPIFALFMILKLMLPIWVMLCVFLPLPIIALDPESVLGWSADGSTPTKVGLSSHVRQKYGGYRSEPGLKPVAATTSHTRPAFFSRLLKRNNQQPRRLAPIKEEDGESSTVVIIRPPTCPENAPERVVNVGGVDDLPLMSSGNSGSSRATESSSVSE